ncbi:cyclopropane fatty acyl phospholipid synthase [Desulfobacterota bacterium M19]
MNFTEHFFHPSPAPASCVPHGSVRLTCQDHKPLHRRLERLLSRADVNINGTRPYDFQVYNPAVYARIFAQGSLGLGEGYMDGWWDSPVLDEFFFRVLRAGLAERVVTWKDGCAVIEARLLNHQSLSRSLEVGRTHYDIGNDFYRRMLDQRMIYSCAYWRHARTLDEAQEAKLDLVCRKLDLKPGMRLLDIGCGWGGMAAYAAERYGVEVLGITISKEQAAYAVELCRELPVTIKMLDYRKLNGTFDRIVSLGMFEHVGYKNYRTFMETVHRLLPEDGLALLHTIGNNHSTCTTDKWIDRYIFPNSMLPSAKQISIAVEKLFVIEDWHNFGADYDTTLMHWFKNFDRAWPEIQGGKYNERFYRMWKYYLLSCAGSFRARKNQVWQLVLSPRGRVGGYYAPR